MRKLTIKRTKTFVACLAKMKVYIEDHSASEITISDVPCRKLGELKNGEEKTFEIGNEAARVFVIADQLSKDYCNDLYELPDGQEDIVLTGKNHFNMTTGNAFRFDNNDSHVAHANRERGKGKGRVSIIVAIIVGVIAGFMIALIRYL